jgi:hypothetical protein
MQGPHPIRHRRRLECRRLGQRVPLERMPKHWSSSVHYRLETPAHTGNQEWLARAVSGRAALEAETVKSCRLFSTYRTDLFCPQPPLVALEMRNHRPLANSTGSAASKP